MEENKVTIKIVKNRDKKEDTRIRGQKIEGMGRFNVGQGNK